MTQVINKYHFKKLPDDAINIMRGSNFGNPFVIGRDGCREHVIDRYRHHLWYRIKNEDGFSEKLLALDGKTLVCCCYPQACHGDVLIKAINYLKEGK
jgi:hypothetical protein